jgi:hypothetical protein
MVVLKHCHDTILRRLKHSKRSLRTSRQVNWSSGQTLNPRPDECECDIDFWCYPFFIQNNIINNELKEEKEQEMED